MYFLCMLPAVRSKCSSEQLLQNTLFAAFDSTAAAAACVVAETGQLFLLCLPAHAARLQGYLLQSCFACSTGGAAATNTDANDTNGLQLHLQDLNLDNVDAVEGLKLNIQASSLLSAC